MGIGVNTAPCMAAGMRRPVREPLQRTSVAVDRTCERIGEIAKMEPDTYDPHKTDTEIRQGSKRKTNLRVLLFSGILIVVAFTAIYLVGYSVQN